jgi:hypothetical protein
MQLEKNILVKNIAIKLLIWEFTRWFPRKLKGYSLKSVGEDQV